VSEHTEYMRMAIDEARSAIRAMEGGPFGALIVREGRVIGTGHNTVLASHDPTAHAEINAIRGACIRLKTHHLTGAVIYTNFEPCPMCLAAIYWADIRTIWFSAGRERAGRLGFLDDHLYSEIRQDPGKREMASHRLGMKEMEELLDEWNRMEDRILY